MISSGDHVIVGLSGGADSMCLLHVLNELKNDFGFTVGAAHVNHLIRGEEAQRDENFVCDYCHKNNISIDVVRIDIPSISLQNGESVELTARKKRYEYFDGLFCDKIATAHSGSDRIETFLMNLSRGSGLNGLCSIPPVRDKIIRPLIDVTRQEIEEYCLVNAIPYITDSTNNCDEYTRNKFRLNVIPQLKAINSNFEANALRCINSLNIENDYIASSVKNELSSRVDSFGRLILDEFGVLQQGIQHRIVMSFLDMNNCYDYETKHIDYICSNINTCFSLTLPHNKKISSDMNYLFFEKKAEEKHFNEVSFNITDLKEKAVSVSGVSIYITKKLPSDKACVYIADADKIDDIITLRHRLSGDTFTFKHRHCTKSLKKLLNEFRVPKEIRNSLLIISDSNGIIYLEKFGINASHCISEETNHFLIIKTESDKNE